MTYRIGTVKPHLERLSPRRGCMCDHCRELRRLARVKYPDVRPTRREFTKSNRTELRSKLDVVKRWRCECGTVNVEPHCRTCQHVPAWAT